MTDPCNTTARRGGYPLTNVLTASTGPLKGGLLCERAAQKPINTRAQLSDLLFDPFAAPIGL